MSLKKIENNKTNKCQFNEAWIGRCNEPADDTYYCDEHKKVKCCKCGGQASRTCSHTYSLVCGAPLCGSCTCHCTERKSFI